MTTKIKSLSTIAQEAKKAFYTLASLSTDKKNEALFTVANHIEKNKELIMSENKKDLDNAEILIKEGKLSKALYGRLSLTEDKMKTMVQGIKDVAKLEDPVNNLLGEVELDENLILKKVSCPLGTIGVIFESRPDVVPQIAALCIKSANTVIMKGGSEAKFSNAILIKIINEALERVEGFPKNTVNLITKREEVAQMLALEEYIDLIIPRGGNSLVKYIKENTKIPVLGHADGICHIYIDASADINKLIDICVDSKIQYPSACNAVETILVNENIAKTILPRLISSLKNNSVLVKGCAKTKAISPKIEEAKEEDWATEYGEKIVSIMVVDNLTTAITHINKYGSGHTDCIISEDMKNVETFMSTVDSAGVYHNASTRFADGFRYGLGAEVGISTNKTHARGPVGLEGLSIYKYKLFGNGQFVAQYSGLEAKTFTHKRLK